MVYFRPRNLRSTVAFPSLLDPLETSFMKLNFALLPRHRIRTADDLALYSPSSCFLLFAVDVLENARLKARSQYCPFEG